MSAPMMFVADCGASRVLLARFSGDKSGSFRVEGVSVVPLEGVSEADWPRQVVAAVLKGAKEFGGAPRVHLVLPGNVCYGKFVKLARVETSKLSKVIQFEAKQSIPYALDEVSYGHQVVADDGVDLDIALAAVKLDVVEPLCRGVEREGSRTITIEPAFITEAAAARALGVGAEEGKAGLLLSIGARTTSVILIEGERYFTRTLNLGGATVTQAMADELGRGFDEAETVKVGLSRGELEAAEDSAEVTAYSNALRTFSSRLVMELTRTLATQKKTISPETISGIFLTGGGSQLQGLSETLAERLRAPLGMLELSGAVETGPGINAEQLAEVQFQLVAAIGVAVREYSAKPSGINLLPARVAAENRFRKQQPFLLAAAACVAGSLAFPIISNYSQAEATRREVARLTDQVSQLDALNREIQKDRGEIERVRSHIAGIEDLARSRSNWLSFFAELQERLYAVGDVWIENLAVSRPGAGDPSQPQNFGGGGGGGMFGDMQAAPPPPSADGSAPTSQAIRLTLSGRLVDRANPLSKVSKEAEERVKRLLRNFSESEFIVSVENERFDNSQKGILQFDFVLVVNPKKPL